MESTQHLKFLVAVLAAAVTVFAIIGGAAIFGAALLR